MKKRLSNLSATTTLDNDDLLHVLTDPAGAAIDKKITVESLVDLLHGAVNVKLFGATGDGVTDDTAAIQAALNAASLGLKYVEWPSPSVSYKITSTISVPDNLVIRCGRVVISATVPNAAAIEIGQNTLINGQLLVNCNNQSGSIGVLFGSLSRSAYFSTIESVHVTYANIGIDFHATWKPSDIAQSKACYFNRLGRARVQYSSVAGIRFWTENADSPGNVYTAVRNSNANHLGTLSIQNATGGSGVLINSADGNVIDYLEAESNSAWAVDIQSAFGIFINGGWIEGNTGNIRIANNPAVVGVYIAATVDSSLNADDTKFSYVASTNRAVEIRGNQFTKEFGRQGFNMLEVGGYGVAASDQDRTPDMIRFASGQYTYKRSDAAPYYYWQHQDTGGIYIYDASGHSWIDMNSSRITLGMSNLPTKVAGTLELTSAAGTGYIELSEQTPSPDAPSSNKGRLFLEDNGSGKSRLVVRFPTGAVQVIATEP